MSEIAKLTMFVDCPKVTTLQSIESCKKCDYYVGKVDYSIMCIYEDK